MSGDGGGKKLGGLFANIRGQSKPQQAVAAREYVLSCVECGAPRVDGSDARACTFCGGNMVSRPACRGCGRGMKPEDAACKSCGAQVS
jgi:rRNA maturation endonuclease Nob1